MAHDIDTRFCVLAVIFDFDETVSLYFVRPKGVPDADSGVDDEGDRYRYVRGLVEEADDAMRAHTVSKQDQYYLFQLGGQCWRGTSPV